MHRSHGVVLVRGRVAEEGEDPVAGDAGDVGVVAALDDLPGSRSVGTRTTAWYGSGSRRSDSSVEPTRSQRHDREAAELAGGWRVGGEQVGRLGVARLPPEHLAGQIVGGGDVAGVDGLHGLVEELTDRIGRWADARPLVDGHGTWTHTVTVSLTVLAVLSTSTLPT